MYGLKTEYIIKEDYLDIILQLLDFIIEKSYSNPRIGNLSLLYYGRYNPSLFINLSKYIKFYLVIY